LPPKELDREARDFIFRETGIYTRLVSPAFVNEELDKFVAKVISHKLYTDFKGVALRLQKNSDFVGYVVNRLTEGKTTAEVVGELVRWRLSQKPLPEELKEELRKKYEREYSQLIDRVVEDYLILSFAKTYRDNADKGHGEALRLSLENLKNISTALGENPLKLINRLGKMVKEMEETTRKAVMVVPKGERTFLFAVNPYKNEEWLKAIKDIKTQKDFENFVYHTFGISRETAEGTDFDNALSFVRNSILARTATVPVSEEAVRKLKEYAPPPIAVDYKRAGEFLNQIVEKMRSKMGN